MKEDQTFINYLADQIIEKYGVELHEVVIVFPNQRAGLFLQEALRSKLGKASWLPEILAVESAFSKWSGIKLADPIDLIFELFNIHFQLEGKSDENLSVFAPYGFQMLRDFEEVDHYLIDREKIFSYLSEAKALEIWHADGSPLSAYEQQYLHFFQLLAHYHKNLHAYMAEKYLGYYGFIARKLAELQPEELLHRIAFKKVVFAGFNVLTKAEEMVFSVLFKADKADFYWDCDQYLLEKNLYGYHEGGQHLRKLFLRNPGLKTSRFISKLQSDKKEIHFIGVSSHIGQAFALASNLTAYHSVAANTAVVLADEKLLLPVLNLIPPKVDHFNVTMGLPFKQGAVFRFVYTLLEAGVYRQKSGRNDVIPLTQFTAIVQNELIRIFLDAEDFEHLHYLRSSLAVNGDLYVSLAQIKHLLGSDKINAYAFNEQLFAILQGDVKSLFELIYVFLNQIVVGSMPRNQDVKISLLLQQLAAYKKLVNRFSVLFRNREAALDFKSLLLLFVNVSKAYQLNLSGEPLQGLQLMGMLETRNLDFETIHLLSANEGNLPLEKSKESLIPSDIRRQFGLPSALDKQAVYAFHFYHLLQHARRIYLYYNAEPDPLGGGEMSRFMLQLKFELSNINPGIKITELDFNFDIPPQQTQKELVINKSEAVLERIKQKLSSGLSPTALSRYLSCSLKFYLTDIVGIREFQQPDGTIALNTLGTIVHQALELLYQPYTSLNLTETHIQDMNLRMEDVLKKVFEMNYPGGMSLHGYNRLAFVVAKKFIEKVLIHEKQSVVNEQNEIMILSQELSLNHVLHVEETNVMLKGTIDRVDRFNGQTRIIDYKTGAVKKSDVQINDQDDFFNEKKAKALQLAVYQWLYVKSSTKSAKSPVVAGILSLRSISEGFLQLTSKVDLKTEDFENAVERTIISIVSELLDVSIPFEQTKNLTTCKHCVFNGFCLRQTDV